MSYQKTLENAIRKAIAGGWELPFEGQIESVELAMATLPGNDQQIPIIRVGVEGAEYLYLVIGDMIFNHDFAKALWGENMYTNKITTDAKGKFTNFDNTTMWKHHLQMMVVDDDPIAYLGAHL